MRTIEIDLYRFDELSDEAKEKIIEENRCVNVDYEWWDSTYEYWKEKLKEHGFTDSKIWFSGFSSQGDGACFDANVEFDIMFTLYKNHVLDNGIARIKRAMQNHENWIYDYLYNEAEFKIASLGSRYCHEHTRRVESYCHACTKGLLSIIYSDFEEWLEEQRLELCRKIYNDLENEYDYLTSEEAITETIRANEMEFTIDGNAA